MIKYRVFAGLSENILAADTTCRYKSIYPLHNASAPVLCTAVNSNIFPAAVKKNNTRTSSMISTDVEVPDFNTSHIV